MTTPIKTSEVRQELARRSLLDFAQYIKRDYHVGYFHRQLCEKLDLFAAKKIKRLMVMAPPRHGKSELVSRLLPARIFGMYPDAQIITASYGADLARQMGRSVQRIMERPRYHRVYPASRLEGSNIRTVADGRYLRNADEFEIVGKRGYYKCAGVGGGITGRGFDFGIIDDPVKDASEAYSEVVRDAVWEWYAQVFLTRQEGNASILLTMTRWHDDDLAGRILRTGEPWEVVKFPALNPAYEGGALWPEKFSAKWLEQQKEFGGANPFEALYQQNPLPAGGGEFKQQYFQVAEKNGSPTLFRLGNAGWRNVMDSYRFVTVDLATSLKTSGDYTAITTCASLPTGELLILDVMRARIEGPFVIETIRQKINAWGCGAAHIERIGFQTSLIQDARRQGLAVFELNADKDKVTRAAPLAALYAAGKVWHAPGDWHADYERELLTFPLGKNDDQVDSAAYACRVHNERLGESFKRFALKI